MVNLAARAGIRPSVEIPRVYYETNVPGNLLSPYAASKLAAEDVCRGYGRLHGIRSTFLRYFTVFGPAGRPDMSPFRFTQWAFEGRPIRIYGDGSQTRDLTCVDDITDGTLAALDRGGEGPYNLGNDHPVKLLDFLGLVAKAAGREVKVEHLPASPADVPATWADISRARGELGWGPKVSCEEGVGRLAEWYRENRAWAAGICTS